MVSARGALALACVAGCDYLSGAFVTNDFSGDQFPIAFENASGGIIVGINEVGTDEQRAAVLDVLSPITLIDRGHGVAPRIETRDLTVYGVRAATGELDLPRARLLENQLVTLHPCDADVCEIGTGIGPRAFNALVGLDVFGGDTLRIRMAANELFILPDVAGDELHRSRSCDAVMPSPFRGGGTLVIGGTEVGFGNWRIAIDACLQPDPDPLLVQNARGVDALFVLSTAFGTSIINESTYERLRQLDEPRFAPLDGLPVHTVFMPSGPINGRLTLIDAVALVGNSGTDPRAPCRQMYASHLLAARNCVAGDDCPCTNNETFCSVPAIVELQPASGISVLVVADSEPVLQALRTELRPDRPEVDGILGTDALLALELDIDRGHDRLLARCIDRVECGARAVLADEAARAYVNGCLAAAPGPFP